MKHVDDSPARKDQQETRPLSPQSAIRPRSDRSTAGSVSSDGRYLAQQLVFGHAHRLGDAAQRIFGDQPVILLAQQQADRRLVVVRFHLRVHRGQIEIELARVFRFERRRLEFDHDVAAKLQVIEQEIDEKLVSADFEPVLPADEREPCTEFEQEPRDMPRQRAVRYRAPARFPRDRGNRKYTDLSARRARDPTAAAAGAPRNC